MRPGPGEYWISQCLRLSNFSDLHHPNVQCSTPEKNSTQSVSMKICESTKIQNTELKIETYLRSILDHRMDIPSGKHTKKLWKITIFNGKTHYKWPCSIAFCMLVYQRVNGPCSTPKEQIRRRRWLSSRLSGLSGLPCLASPGLGVENDRSGEWVYNGI